jgi:hypothetical protein
MKQRFALLRTYSLALDPRVSHGKLLVCLFSVLHCLPKGRRWALTNESNQANRAISTGKLNALPHLHTRPINVVVYHGSQGRTRFEVGFSLRCLQRLSRPYVATLQCGWRHNSSTRGTFIPVLSY